MKERPEPIIQPVQEEQEREISPEQILGMSPKELVGYLSGLEKSGKIESFLRKVTENDSLVAMLSYWEKWLKKDHQDLVDKMVEEKKKMYPGDSESLPLNLEKKFNPEELELILRNLGAIQLTFGCSKGCPFCGFDAIKGVREAIPYSQLANLFQNYGKFWYRRNTHLILYWASEPSDYAFKEGLKDRTYEDVEQLAVQYTDDKPGITSRENRDEKWLDFLASRKENGVIYGASVSVYGLKEEEYSEITKRSIEIVGQGKEHLKGIGISSMKYDPERKIGIGCFDGVLLTPRGLYNVVQVPISEQYPQGQILTPIERIASKEIKIGDSLLDILKAGIIVKRHPLISKWDFLGRYLTVQSGDKTYDIAIDENYKITDMLLWNKTEEHFDNIGVTDGGRMTEDKRERMQRREKLLEKNIITKGYNIDRGDI